MKRWTLLQWTGALAIATVLAAQQPPATTTTPQPAPAAAQGPSLVLNLPNASLAEVIDTLARQLKINYILDPRVKGTITVQTYGEIKAADVRGLLETILRVNGYSMVQVGELYRIIPAAEANKLPVPVRNLQAKDLPDDEMLVLNLVFLKYASAAEIAKLTEQFLGEGAKQVVYEPANLLLLLDNARNMRRTMELISLFDSDTLVGQRIRLYEMKNVRPSEMARELDRVVSTLGLSQKAAVQFLPIERLNTLVIFAPNPGAFEQIEKWVEKLDVEPKAPVGGTDNYVFRVKYGRAESLAMAVTLLYLSQNLNPSDTLTYMWLLNMLNMVSVQQTAQASAVPGQAGQAGFNQFGGGMGMGMMGMMPGMMGMMPGMMGMGGMGMMGMMPGMMGMGGMGQNFAYGNPVQAGVAGAAPSPGGAAAGSAAAGQAGTYLGAGGGYGMGMGMPQVKVPRLIPNPWDNSLLIQATPQEYTQIEKLLRQIDVPPRQVLIEAKIYEVILSDAFSSGIQAFLQRRGTATQGLDPLGAATANGINLTAGFLVGQARELFATLNASEEIRRTKVLSAPSVVATDNIPASINVGTDVPVLTSAGAVGGVQSGGTSVFANTIQNRNAGVTLTITARVQPSGIVTMIVNQEVSSAVAPSARDAIQSPSFQRRNVQTQITVQDGDMVAIGGIIQENNLNTNSGLPGLVKIPILGSLLGGKSVTKQRTELVIFLTPRVIYDTNQVREATEEIKQNMKRISRMLPKK